MEKRNKSLVSYWTAAKLKYYYFVFSIFRFSYLVLFACSLEFSKWRAGFCRGKDHVLQFTVHSDFQYIHSIYTDFSGSTHMKINSWQKLMVDFRCSLHYSLEAPLLCVVNCNAKVFLFLHIHHVISFLFVNAFFCLGLYHHCPLWFCPIAKGFFFNELFWDRNRWFCMDGCKSAKNLSFKLRTRLLDAVNKTDTKV